MGDDFHATKGFTPSHGVFTLGDFVDMLVSGRLEPTENPNEVHQ